MGLAKEADPADATVGIDGNAQVSDGARCNSQAVCLFKFMDRVGPQARSRDEGGPVGRRRIKPER